MISRATWLYWFPPNTRNTREMNIPQMLLHLTARAEVLRGRDGVRNRRGDTRRLYAVDGFQIGLTGPTDPSLAWQKASGPNASSRIKERKPGVSRGPESKLLMAPHFHFRQPKDLNH